MTIRRSRFASVKIAGLGVSIVVALAGVYSAGKSAAQGVSNSPGAKSSAAPTATDKTAAVGSSPADSAPAGSVAAADRISLVDVEIADGTTASYGNPNTKYLVDWLVIKK